MYTLDSGATRNRSTRKSKVLYRILIFFILLCRRRTIFYYLLASSTRLVVVKDGSTSTTRSSRFFIIVASGGRLQVATGNAKLKSIITTCSINNQLLLLVLEYSIITQSIIDAIMDTTSSSPTCLLDLSITCKSSSIIMMFYYQLSF